MPFDTPPFVVAVKEWVEQTFATKQELTDAVSTTAPAPTTTTSTPDRLIPVTESTAVRPGTVLGELIGYENVGTAAITVGDVPLSPNEGVILRWDGTVWSQPSMKSSAPAPDITDPVWDAVLTTGDPTDTSVVISATALATDDRGVVGYFYRMGAGSGVQAEPIDTRRSITRAGLNFSLTGLDPQSNYGAPIIWAEDEAGNRSNELVAQPFATDPRPKQWTRALYNSLSGVPDGTLLGDVVPKMGSQMTLGGDPGEVRVKGGEAVVIGTTNAYISKSAEWSTVNGNFTIAMALDYALHGPSGETAHWTNQYSIGLSVSGNNPNQGISARIANGTMAIDGGTKSVIIPQTSGRFGMRVTGSDYKSLTVELLLDGAVMLTETVSITENYGTPTYFGYARFGIGGGDVQGGGGESWVHTKGYEVEYFQ